MLSNLFNQNTLLTSFNQINIKFIIIHLASFASSARKYSAGGLFSCARLSCGYAPLLQSYLAAYD